MRGRKRKLPDNYAPPAYISSSENENEPRVQRRREVQQQHQQQQQQQQGHDDENLWIDIDNDLFMSEDDQEEGLEEQQQPHQQQQHQEAHAPHSDRPNAPDGDDDLHDYVSSDQDPEEQGTALKYY